MEVSATQEMSCTFASCSKAGAELNQDASCVMSCGPRKTALFLGVMDGHGIDGHKISQRLSRDLPSALCSSSSFQAGTLHQAFTSSFAHMNQAIWREDAFDSVLSGSTAVAAVLHEDGRLSVANVGDSRCIVGSVDAFGKVSATALTRDHVPDDPSEAARVFAHQGRIGPSPTDGCGGPKRVWLRDYAVPGLAMTRAFGDRLAARVGVIAEPEVQEFQLGPADKYLVLCSDGLTNVMSNDTAVQHVHEWVAVRGRGVTEAAEALVSEARRLWLAQRKGHADDCTAVVCLLSLRSKAPASDDPWRHWASRHSCILPVGVSEADSQPGDDAALGGVRRGSYDVGVSAWAVRQQLPGATASRISPVLGRVPPGLGRGLRPSRALGPVLQLAKAPHPFSLLAAQHASEIEVPCSCPL